MKVSVIIPTYNESKVIESCLLSLDHQKYRDFEVIVIDDGSKDNTRELIHTFTPHNFKLRLLTQKHQGPATARNKGASAATGEILVFVDADMSFSQNFLKELTLPVRTRGVVGTYSDNEIVGNWKNVWARCWNIQEGIKGRSRHKSSKRYLYQNIYDYLAYVVTNNNFSYKKFSEKRNETKTNVFRAILKKNFLKVNGYDVGGYTDDYSLGKKIGEKPKNANSARFYHNNPDNLLDVFMQAKWSAKRDYRFGLIGYIYTILKSLVPVSLLVGVFKAIQYKELYFVIFKVIYDFGVILGIIEYKLLKKGSK